MTVIRSEEFESNARVAAARRMPIQQRSRERVERILNAATELIARSGSDALRMSEVAEQAGVPIGSLYQYFPDKSAIIRTLAERFNAVGLACVETELVNVRSEDELRTALNRSIDGYYEMFLAEPVIRDIWSGTLAARDLRDIAVSDVRAHAAQLLVKLIAIYPETDHGRLSINSLLLMQLLDATVRLAISVSHNEAKALLDAFKHQVIASVSFD